MAVSNTWDPDHWLSSARPGYPPAIERLTMGVRWGGEYDRVTVGRGWWPVLARLDERLARIDPHYDLSGVHTQNGILHSRVWSTTQPDAFGPLIREAMDAANRTCEFCGGPGDRLGDDNDVAVVLCNAHAGPEAAAAHLFDTPLSRVKVASLTQVVDETTSEAMRNVFRSAVAGIRVPVVVGTDTRSEALVEQQWSALNARLDMAFGRRTEFTVAISSYALSHPGDVHLEEVQEIHDEYGAVVPASSSTSSVITSSRFGSGNLMWSTPLAAGIEFRAEDEMFRCWVWGNAVVLADD